MSKKEFSIVSLLLKIAMGCMFIVSGIWVFQGGGDAGAVAVQQFFGGDLGRILRIVYGVIELMAGVLLVLSLFIGKPEITRIFMIIIMIVWIVAIVLMDIVGIGNVFSNFSRNFLGWLYQISMHVVILAGIIYLI